MEKLELKLKHIAPYLPYRLQWTLQEMKTFTMSGITRETLYTEEGKVLNWDLSDSNLPQALFPLLIPLSVFSVHVKMGVYMDKYDCSLTVIQEIFDFINFNIPLQDVTLKTYNMMCRNHIDFHKLIKRGLAIDKNTITT